MKLHKEKNDSDSSQVILDRNQKPVPPVLLSDVFANSKIESLSELEQYIKECDPVMTKKAIKYLEDKGCRNR